MKINKKLSEIGYSEDTINSLYDQVDRIVVGLNNYTEIPDFLKIYAGLGKNVIIAGVYNRLEIWDEKKWKTYKINAEKNTDEIAEQLGKLGVY